MMEYTWGWFSRAIGSEIVGKAMATNYAMSKKAKAIG